MTQIKVKKCAQPCMVRSKHDPLDKGVSIKGVTISSCFKVGSKYTEFEKSATKRNIDNQGQTRTRITLLCTMEP